ncbi:uncharacterized protein LOC124869581 [Girardinichthys multiradiatus]|uniref:uncharacterized protein LOC124869581 n=1 Tax=Girardinichthys multiradiatus TaxID=208333 RepID=UPI001FACEDFB|nr:uncharacterized protein LOC124869581 [Girardinichthys multiradiatus]XP_047223475.1 uncharacterized protein LOC124869581 [Girardinichthys multiradiatus]
MSPRTFCLGRCHFRGSGGFTRRWWIAFGPPSARRTPSPVSPDPPDASEGSSGQARAPAGSPLLAREDLVSSAAQALLQLADVPPIQERPPFPDGRPDSPPRSGSPETLAVASTGAGSAFSHYGGSVGQTMTGAWAPSTRAAYGAKWAIFAGWCRGKGLDPIRCPVSHLLSFLQELLDLWRSPSTLKVYVAAISRWHVGFGGCSVGWHGDVALFLKGARRLCPPRRPVAPTWDLSLVLAALQSPPFDPITGADLKWLSLKTAFLLAIASAKRVGELHALSVSEPCCRWNPDGSGVTLWTNASFVPKVPAVAGSVLPLRLSRFNPGAPSEPLCPVRALEAYVRSMAPIRRTDCLFVCYAGSRKGQALSRQRLARWIVEMISVAYSLQDQPLPSGVRCHSTRSLSTSWAAMTGVPLEAICEAASWTAPSTFARLYRVNVATPHPLQGILEQPPSASR